ncbi:Prefoldin subunit 2 [Halocaridina rubra]|uniref:Prefoldin subunit 2 n=1 Tax=Halocaridina rubra TaxID=373956 RepID=A0AAN9AHA5_HALRR
MADKQQGESGNTAKPLTKSEGEEIVQKFQTLRNEQRSLMAKISELEQDLNEHKIVIETLQDVSPDRKCFRMVGGVLVERTVNEILPALTNNRDQLSKVIDSLNEKLVNKGKEVNEYKEKHGIRIRGQDDIKETQGQQTNVAPSTQGVLVSNKS